MEHHSTGPLGDLDSDFRKLRALQFEMGVAQQDFVGVNSVTASTGGAGGVLLTQFEQRTGVRLSSGQQHQVNEYIKEQVLAAVRDLSDRLL
jgi:hypothetical protein